MSNFRLRQENLRRAEAAGTTIATEPEKPIGLSAYRKKAKESAQRAKEARKKRGLRVWNGGRFSSR